jgi:hypothetical protein
MKRALLIVAGLCGLAAAGCAPAFIRALPQIPEDEAITRPSLAGMAMQPGSTYKVVLRVPTAQRIVAEEERRATGELDQAYNIIEKEFLKTGFTVRDRALLSEVLRTNPNLDYRSIRDKIDTNFIIEVVSLTKFDFSTRDYEIVSGRSRHTSFAPLKLEGWRLEAKIILVETGEIGGIFTHYAPPQFAAKPEERYFFYLADAPENPYVRTATAQGEEQPQSSGYTLLQQDAATLFARKLIVDIRGK